MGWDTLDDGEYKWKVLIVSDIPVETDEDVEAGGCCVLPKANKPGQIYLRGNLSAFRTKHTLLHEILHGCEYAEDIALDDAEVDAIARYLTRLLTNNPKLGRFLSKKGG